MRIRSVFLHARLLCSVLLVLGISAAGTRAQEKPKIPEAEAKAAQAVQAAVDTNAKFVAAEDFVKKFPKSEARKHVVDHIADQIFGEKDLNQKVTYAQRALKDFTQDSEVNEIKPALIDAYISLERYDDAFTEGASFLAKNPDNIQILANLTIAGTEQATKKRNPKFVPQSQQYGTKAVELLEADKKPAYLDAEVWSRNKKMLPVLYQELGIISLMQQNATDAKSKLEKALTLNPADPFNYVLLGSLTNDEYQKVAQAYKGMPDGKSKEETLAKANQLLDKVIDQFAHAVALSESRPDYKQLHDQVMEDLTSYYKYRHSSSTDGLQKLIDSYKTPANP